MFALASRTYRTMTATSYSHHYSENTSTGVYDFDCVGAVDWFLSEAAPQAKVAMSKAEHIRKLHVPTPTRMFDYLSSKASRREFTRVRRAANIQPGDSRRWDTRTQPSQANPSTLHSGLGFGTIAIHTTARGAPARMSWSVGVGEEPHPFLVSRPKPERGARSAPAGQTPAPS